MDWDAASIIKALEELYRLQAEHYLLDFGQYGDYQLGQYGAGTP